MATLMANIRKFVNQIPIEKDVNSKLEVLWHAKGTLMENLTPSLMTHQIGTPKSKFIKIIMAHYVESANPSDLNMAKVSWQDLNCED